ncbi:MAG: hypothetical protein EOM54_01010 [Clostridia bacterium]|nr:hypothetical protein [Clostridia bacterium]NCC68268.1 hypothetical protein [Clostridia bacterium]
MIFLLVMGYAVLALIDLPQLYKNRRWWEFFVCSVLMALAFTLTVLMMLNVEVPNPVRTTQYVVRWLFEQIHLTYD